METIYVRIEKDIKLKFEATILALRSESHSTITQSAVVRLLIAHFIDNAETQATILAILESSGHEKAL